MKFKNIKSLKKLFEIIDSCYGRVDLVSQDMVLNLKSNLAKYFAFSQLVSDGIVEEMELRAYDSEDIAKLTKFMMEGKEYNGRGKGKGIGFEKALRVSKVPMGVHTGTLKTESTTKTKRQARS